MPVLDPRADDERLEAGVAYERLPQGRERGRHDAGDDRVVETAASEKPASSSPWRNAIATSSRVQPCRVDQSQLAAQLGLREDAEGGVRVPDVDREEHPARSRYLAGRASATVGLVGERDPPRQGTRAMPARTSTARRAIRAVDARSASRDVVGLLGQFRHTAAACPARPWSLPFLVILGHRRASSICSRSGSTARPHRRTARATRASRCSALLLRRWSIRTSTRRATPSAAWAR